MELKDFVSQTLVQIVQGVTEAQRQVGEDAVISPVVMSLSSLASEHGFLQTNQGHAQIVRFDVAVSASSDTEARAGGGIKVMSVSIGGEKATADKQSSVSHVQFSVPVVLPGAEQEMPKLYPSRTSTDRA